jgi:hypothetical protein
LVTTTTAVTAYVTDYNERDFFPVDYQIALVLTTAGFVCDIPYSIESAELLTAEKHSTNTVIQRHFEAHVFGVALKNELVVFADSTIQEGTKGCVVHNNLQ